MNPRALDILGVALALAVSAAALLLAAGPDQKEYGLVVAPFAWAPLLVAHVLAALPLSVVAARALGGNGSVLRLVLWVALGVAAAGMTIANGAAVGTWLDGRQADSIVRLGVRVVWCLALQLPWCLFGRDLAGGPARPPGVAVALLAVVVAVALPGSYTVSLIDSRSARVEPLLQRGQLARAQRLVEGLCDLGSGQAVVGQPPQDLKGELRRVLRDYALAVGRRLPRSAPDDLRVRRAEYLIALDRLDEAERELGPLAGEDPVAALLLAAIAHDRQRWDEGGRHCRAALTLMEGLPGSDPAAVANRVKAYDELALNARERKAFAEAEAMYHEALDKVPAAQAHFHFQLGRHYQDAGRPAKAREHLEAAARLDPAYAERARPLIKGLNEHTPGCVLRP